LRSDVLGERAEVGVVARIEIVAIGNSAGTIALSYFLAGQADKVNEEYWAALRQLKIFGPMRFWRIVDVDRGASRVVQPRIRTARTAIHRWRLR